MDMTLSASALRQDLYRKLDTVLKTGIPLEIKRRNGRLRIIPVQKKSKIGNLKKRNVLKCPPDDLVHIDWSEEWRP
jgi:hypothetical protein